MSFQKCKIVATGVDPADYHKQEGIERGDPRLLMSSSVLRDFASCPSRWMRGHERPGTAATDYGNLLETILLMPHTLQDHYAIIPATYETTGMKCPHCGSVTESQKCRECKCERVPCRVEKPWSRKSETCQEWIEARKIEGKRVVAMDGDDKHPGVREAQSACARLREDELIAAYLSCCEFQVHVTGEWVDAGTKLVVPCQCLIDLMPRTGTEFAGTLGDLKTARSGFPPFFSKDSTDRGYGVQAAWNLDMLNAAEGLDTDNGRHTFHFIVSENIHPWEPSRIVLSQDKLEAGRSIYTENMQFYCDCLKRDEWPGYQFSQDPEHDATFLQGWSVDSMQKRDEWQVEAAMARRPSIETQLASDDTPNESDITP